ncbi:hypothetical protein NL676_017893 [Syzygium grande]|nr:hypothetical protein NL676_017893 [Syzygium grande]
MRKRKGQNYGIGLRDEISRWVGHDELSLPTKQKAKRAAPPPPPPPTVKASKTLTPNSASNGDGRWMG